MRTREHLGGRSRLTYDWIPRSSRSLLDIGCSFGDNAERYTKKCIGACVGIDPNKDYLVTAKKKHPRLEFYCSGVENTPFKAKKFDMIIMNDVIEHVHDEIIAFNEVYRILREKGLFLLTTPHKGLFSFMDTDNYVLFLKKYIYPLYRLLYKVRNGSEPSEKPGYVAWHRHYSKKEMLSLLDRSAFEGNYSVIRIKRSSFIMNPLRNNIDAILSVVPKNIRNIVLWPFNILTNFEYLFSFGPLAYNLAILIKKEK